MSWLTRLVLGKPRAAADLGAILEIDLRRLAVCHVDGTTSRDQIEERLGPPTDLWLRRRNILAYDQIGVRFDLDARGTATGVFVTFDGSRDRWRWLPAGDRTCPGEAALVKLLGPPTSREVDDEEVMLQWQRGPVLLGVDYSLAGVMVDLFIDLR